MSYKNKQIAVLGFGSSGEAAARLLAEEGAMTTILDSADLKKLRSKIEKITPLGISVLAGVDADTDPRRYDRGILSPGIDPGVPLVQNFLRKRIEMIGELEFSWELCKCPVVAITGTNGKTTTTELVARMLNLCGIKTLAAGNIGPAFAAVVKKSGDMDVMTLEVSSFQLEEIRTFRPHIAVWLNFTPDHLDRYPDMESYRRAKLRIFENQTAEDFAVIKLDDMPAVVDPAALRARVITFSAARAGGDFELRDGVIHFRGEAVLAMRDVKLRGVHNAENLMAALGVGYLTGLGFEAMAEPLATYTPQPHRCELVGTVDGVDYVNDSKATNIDALEKALLSETRPIVLIAGGKDKGFEFGSIAGLIAQKVRHVVLIGEMAGRIAALWEGHAPCERASSLEDAVRRARGHARAGEVVLFSPGTSSFDMFQNYADRGNQFRNLVQNL
ncbi:MAG: UDP-N-acetylmuramoyl-L-alanine--D-glutamate ligase [Chthoniobacteraceae bacterium]|jgi:UDP-N-acetylmuramoylalanine--D-glutamate ligase